MAFTIKTKLLGLAVGGLVFVAGVSVAGYWGITSVTKTTVQVAALGKTIRNHVEAGMFNDMTREDINAICTRKGQDQQDAITNLNTHLQLLAESATAARNAVADPTLQATLDGEGRTIKDYQNAGDAFSKAIVSDPSTAVAVAGRALQLFSTLQQGMQDSGDQLTAAAQEAELSATRKASRTTHAMFVICGISLLMLFVGSAVLYRTISQSLQRLTQMVQNIAEGEGDVTQRVETAGAFGNDEL